MSKLTVAQLREKEVERLASFHAEEFTAEDKEKARKLMNSFYRLCGLAERNLHLSNDERTFNSKYTAKSEERENNWHKRLSEEFKSFADLQLVYFGYLPSICEKCASGGYREKISRYFYD